MRGLLNRNLYNFLIFIVHNKELLSESKHFIWKNLLKGLVQRKRAILPHIRKVYHKKYRRVKVPLTFCLTREQMLWTLSRTKRVRARGLLSWVHQKAVPMGLAPHQGCCIVTSGVPLLQGSCIFLAAERSFIQGWLHPSPALKAGMRGEVMSSAELWNAGSTSAGIASGKLSECSDVSIRFLARMLLLQAPWWERGGQLVPPDGDQRKEMCLDALGLEGKITSAFRDLIIFSFFLFLLTFLWLPVAVVGYSECFPTKG